jgi:hypothetical protein
MSSTKQTKSTPSKRKMDDKPEVKVKEEYAYSKALFDAQVSAPCTKAKYFSGNAGTTAEGVVIGAKEIKVHGKSGMNSKIQLNVCLYSISTGEKSPIIPTGINGLAFGFPVKQMEASPEDIAKDQNAKGPQLIDFSQGNRMGLINVISPSFYLDSGFSKNRKDDAPSDASSLADCTPGTCVLLSGISCVFGPKPNKDGILPIYVNAKKVQPIQSPVASGMAAKSIITNFKSSKFQNLTSFLLSLCCHGFYNSNGEFAYTNPEHIEQAEVFEKSWKKLLDIASEKCDNLASIQHAGNTDVINILKGHATRLRAMSSQEAAKEGKIFECDIQDQCATPYISPIVQSGVELHENGGVLCKSLHNSSLNKSLPPRFCEAVVKNIQFKGSLITVEYGLYFVGDTEKAIDAVKNEKGPILCTPDHANALVKISMKKFGPEVIGSYERNKIEVVIKETMYVMDHAATAHIFPAAFDCEYLDGHFSSTAGYDMIDGISKVGVQVSQEWINDKMLGGRGVLIHKHPDDVELVPSNLPLTGPVPTLSKNWYQALSEGSFDWDSLSPTNESTIKFYVIYDGCKENVKNVPSINISIESGQQHIESICLVMRDDNDIKSFLRNDCVVYAILCQ